VETALNPAYRDVPMAVCGRVEARHGIVLAKNELAKKYGIQTAETVYSAKKKCKNLVIASPHYEEYERYSKAVNDIYKQYTDAVEPFGIDESWLDVTHSTRIFGSGVEIAEKIRQEVKEKLGITVSIGVSFNKVFAKLGSDYKKPDAITVIDENNFRDIVYPLPVDTLLYIGAKTRDIMTRLGIKTIGQLAEADLSLLRIHLGKMADLLFAYANGEDESPVLSESEREARKSIGNGLTFRHDLVNLEEIKVGIEYLAEELGQKLRQERMKAGAVQITIKDEFLKSIQRRRQFSKPTDIAREISRLAMDIFLDQWSVGKPIRMLTVTVLNLTPSDSLAEQIDMFAKDDEVGRERSKRREETIDKIRKRFGKTSILSASYIKSDIGIFDFDNADTKTD
jgi:DNA polymerase-4